MVMFSVFCLSFLWRGVTLANLRTPGNIPTSKQRLTNFDNHTETNNLKLPKRKTGILLGPVDFFTSRISIIFPTSPGTGERERKKN